MKRGIHHERVIRLCRNWRWIARVYREKANGYGLMMETRRAFMAAAIESDGKARELYKEVISE